MAVSKIDVSTAKLLYAENHDLVIGKSKRLESKRQAMDSFRYIGVPKIRQHFLKQSIFVTMWLLIVTLVLSACIRRTDKVVFNESRPFLSSWESISIIITTVVAGVAFILVAYAFYLLVKCASGNENALVNVLTQRGSLEYAIVTNIEENSGLTTISCLTIPSMTKRGKFRLTYRTDLPVNLSIGDKAIALVLNEKLSCLL